MFHQIVVKTGKSLECPDNKNPAVGKRRSFLDRSGSIASGLTDMFLPDCLVYCRIQLFRHSRREGKKSNPASRRIGNSEMRTLLDRFYDYVISPGRKKVSPCGQIKKMKKLSFLIWWKREYYFVSIQRSSERVFIGRKNMTFFLGIIGQSVYEI